MPQLVLIGGLLISTLFGGGYLLDKLDELKEDTPSNPLFMAGSMVAAGVALYLLYHHFKKK
jgi:hypothetical protein